MQRTLEAPEFTSPPPTSEHEVDSDYEEELALHRRIGIATATFYPNWYPTTEENVRDKPTVDKLRGDLALATLAEIKNGGYKGIVVDGGSSAAFLEAAEAIGVPIQPEDKDKKGMSASRRQALAALSQVEGVETLVWTEPEKVSIVQDCIDGPAQMVLNGEADIVIPTRDEAGFQTYPDYQAEFEQQSNQLWNGILRRHNVMPEDAPDLDAWIGPRVFKNTPEILELFQREYQYIPDVHNGLTKDSPDLWPNALFLPVVNALAEGYSVKGYDVPYRHPEEQTQQEKELGEIFAPKRAFQQKAILVATVHLLRLLEGASASRLELVDKDTSPSR